MMIYLLQRLEKYYGRLDQNQRDKLSDKSVCVLIGKGKNQKFFEMINKEYKFFNNFITLPHPRWILQYKMKMKKEYLDEYVTKLSNIKL